MGAGTKAGIGEGKKIGEDRGNEGQEAWGWDYLGGKEALQQGLEMGRDYGGMGAWVDTDYGAGDNERAESKR